MNKTIIININEIVFHIEEEAYETLRAYMIDIKKHFSQTPDSEEILVDIENRVAEMFNERIHQGKKEVITQQDVNEIINQMGRVSDFEESEDTQSKTSNGAYQHTIKDEQKNSSSGKKLLRDSEDKVLAGVCSGLGHYFEMQPKWIRIFFLLFFILGGSGVLLYIILWIVMPKATSRADKMAMKGEAPNLHNFKKNFEEELDGYNEHFAKAKTHFSKGAQTIGSSISGVLRFFVKCIGFILLASIGFTILGMFGTLIFGLLGIFTNQVDVLPPLEYMSHSDAFIALIAGFLGITIPFVALFFLLLRMLFRVKPMNNYLALGLWAAWLLSIIMIVYFVFDTNSSISETSTVKVEQKLERRANYIFTEKDLRVIEASTSSNGQRKLKINGKKLTNDLYERIRIDFEPLDSLKQPYVQYNYTAKGKSRQQALEYASQIDYAVHQMDNTVYLDSHFTISSFTLKKDHRVRVVIFLPIGSKLIIAENLENKLEELSLWECAENYADSDHVKNTEWIMTKTGLVCAMKTSTKEQD